MSKVFPKCQFAVLSTCIKLPSVFKTIVLYIFEWLLKTGFTSSRVKILTVSMSSILLENLNHHVAAAN